MTDPGVSIRSANAPRRGVGRLAVMLAASALCAASDRISVTSRLVMVPVTVTDTKGRAILGLDREHFQVTEDSEAREIVSLTRQDGAAALGIVLDLSGSMRPASRHALDAARAIAAVAGEGDEAFLMTFSYRPELRVPLTRYLAAIGRALTHVPAHGNTALADAIWQGLEQARLSNHPRRSLVAISDGGENASRHRLAELKRFAIEADTRIHSIAIQRPYRKGD